MIKRLNKNEVDALPEKTRKEIYETLKAYDSVNVEYREGEYVVNTFVGLTTSYASDYKMIGDVFAEDIYTSEERVKNYEESFGCKCYIKMASNIG